MVRGTFGVSGRLKSIVKHRNWGLGKTACCAKTEGPILTILYAVYDFLRKALPFGGRDEAAPHLGGKSPKSFFFKSWSVNRQFQAKLVKY